MAEPLSKIFSLDEAEALALAELQEIASRYLVETERTFHSFSQRVTNAHNAAQAGAQVDVDPVSPKDSCKDSVSPSLKEEEHLQKEISTVLEEKLTDSKPVSKRSRKEDWLAGKSMTSNQLTTRPSRVITQRDSLAPSSRGDKHKLGLLGRWQDWWMNLEEPEPETALAHFVHSVRFELLTMLIIALNGALVIYQTDKAAYRATRNAFPDGEGRKPPGPDDLEWDTIADYCFTLYYLVELLLKLFIHRHWFFLNEDMGWNIFDLVAITMAIVDIIFNLTTNEDQWDVEFLRVVRVFRMMRTLRVLRALHVVKSLRQLVDCILSSFSGLFWCIVLLLFITCTFSVFLVQTATFFWEDWDAVHAASMDDQDRRYMDQLKKTFSSVPIAMLNLLKATSGGKDWGSYQDMLWLTGWVGPAILVIYVLFFIIAAWNIVTSLFVERALALAEPDVESRMWETKQRNLADSRELLEIMKSGDVDESGTISFGEFHKLIEDEHVRQFLELKGIDIKDAVLFFHMLEAAAHSQEINLNVAVNGLMRMRGIATNLDLHALNFSINSVHHSLSNHLKHVRESLSAMEAKTRLLTAKPSNAFALAL